MANHITVGEANYDLEPSLALAESGDRTELAIAGWWVGGAESTERVVVDLESESVARELLLMGILHSVKRHEQHKVIIGEQKISVDDLLVPSAPKPPNANWYVFDENERAIKTRILPNLAHPRTHPPSDGEVARYSRDIVIFPWLYDLTPMYMNRTQISREFDDILAHTVRNVQYHSGTKIIDGKSLAIARSEQRNDSWLGEVIVSDDGMGIPQSLVNCGAQGVQLGLRINRWTPEHVQAVADDSSFALTALKHLVATKHLGAEGRDEGIDPFCGYGLWRLAHSCRFAQETTVATTDQTAKGSKNVAVHISKSGDVEERHLDLPSPTKGTLVHVRLMAERPKSGDK